MRRLFLLAAVCACSEYDLSAGTQVASGSSPTGTEPPAVCDPDEPPAYAVDSDPSCVGEAIVGQFDPVVEWTWTDNPTHPTYHQVMSTPMVANLTDDDGDGLVDADDVPDVVFVTFTGGSYTDAGALNVVSGADGSQHWSIVEAGGYLPYSSGGIAIGDLEGDGTPEIVLPALGGLLCVDHTGAFEWFAPVTVGAYAMPAIADIDGDGLAEVVLGASVVNHDGSIRWIGTGGIGGPYYASFPADLDGDGLMEIVAGSTVYENDGTIRWNDGQDGTPAIGDFDGDGVPEIVRVYGSTVSLVDVHGVARWSYVLSDGGGGPPTVADFDGDGLPEVGVASREVYRVLDSDGTELWANIVQDYSSSVTGSSVFDFEGDGAAEVVYADEETLWVFDGGTGAVELAYDTHSSGTLLEYPVVVDVDQDGAAEIVVASNDYSITGSHGITVIGDSAGTWAPARPVWNQHAYHITNVDDDNGVPVQPVDSWTSWNSFRAGNSETASGLALPDFAVGDPESCLTECAEDRVVAWIPVENQGAAVGGMVTVALYRVDAADELLDVHEVGLVKTGGAAWVGPIALLREDFGPGGLRVVVDDGELVTSQKECDESNNSWLWAAFPCP